MMDYFFLPLYIRVSFIGLFFCEKLRKYVEGFTTKVKNGIIEIEISTLFLLS